MVWRFRCSGRFVHMVSLVPLDGLGTGCIQPAELWKYRMSYGRGVAEHWSRRRNIEQPRLVWWRFSPASAMPRLAICKTFDRARKDYCSVVNSSSGLSRWPTSALATQPLWESGHSTEYLGSDNGFVLHDVLDWRAGARWRRVVKPAALKG
ncbi:hypothetical protein GGR57DRAFT_463187 [Xylariaceae sp. FL1272]|nr:hypothetical protein GGR57DRAFT_463187 [Xylariaceae sp. FL1272]